MKTADMVALADQNGKTYVSMYGTYSKLTGFKLSFSVHSASVAKLLDNLLHDDIWTVKVDRKKMTKAEIEKILGYPIEIEGYEPKKETTLTDLEQQAYERIIKSLFG